VLSDAPASSTICGYWPLPTEPLAAELWDRLSDNGYQVVLPVVVGAAPLDWAVHRRGDALRGGALGIAEPLAPPLGPGAAATAGDAPAIAAPPAAWATEVAAEVGRPC
jgi:5-formyltetrahydrofolate cyclo-ligase